MVSLRRRQSSASAGPPEDDDAAVLRALTDRAAFAPLYERYVDAIYGRCYRALGEREAAKDVTSHVFNKALEKLDSYHGGSFRAWLYTIADNTLSDHLQSARVKRPAFPLDDGADWLDPAPGPEEQALMASERERLRWAMAQLTDESRRVVELKLDGFSAKEIAEIIGNGRTVDWVRQTHHRAMQKLRDLLGDDWGTKGGAR